jgi:hypothetical protein
MPNDPDVFIGNFTVSVQQNRIQLGSHGLLDGDQVRFALGDPSYALPAPLVEGTYYFVVGVRANDFQVAQILDGPELIVTNNGTGTNQVWKQGLVSSFYEYMVVQQNALEGERCTNLNQKCAEGWELVQWTEPYFLVRRTTTGA